MTRLALQAYVRVRFGMMVAVVPQSVASVCFWMAASCFNCADERCM